MMYKTHSKPKANEMLDFVFHGLLLQFTSSCLATTGTDGEDQPSAEGLRRDIYSGLFPACQLKRPIGA